MIKKLIKPLFKSRKAVFTDLAIQTFNVPNVTVTVMREYKSQDSLLENDICEVKLPNGERRVFNKDWLIRFDTDFPQRMRYTEAYRQSFRSPRYEVVTALRKVPSSSPEHQDNTVYEVELPDGTREFISADWLEPATRWRSIAS